MLPREAQNYLRSLRMDPNAQIWTSYIPLGGIFWSDEMPDSKEFGQLPEADQYAIYRLFSIRFSLWHQRPLNSDDENYWRCCCEAFPDCPIMKRTALSPELYEAQTRVEAEIAEEMGWLFGGGDNVKIESPAPGVQTYSLTIDLTKDKAPPPSIWKRLLGWIKGKFAPPGQTGD